MDKGRVAQLILEILADGVTRSTQQVLAEFAAEYPKCFRLVQEEWVGQNGYNCGSIQYPLTVVSSVLEELTTNGKLSKAVKGQKLWTMK